MENVYFIKFSEKNRMEIAYMLFPLLPTGEIHPSNLGLGRKIQQGHPTTLYFKVLFVIFACFLAFCIVQVFSYVNYFLIKWEKQIINIYIKTKEFVEKWTSS